MHMLRHTLVALAFAVVAVAAHAATDPEVLTPVPAVLDGRLEISHASGRGQVPVQVSRDWTQPQADVTRAVVMVHGWGRRDLQAAERAAAQAGAATDGVLRVAPQFLIQADVDAHHLPTDTLRWGPNAWAAGHNAQGPVPISSFDVLDAILSRLADPQRFPALRTVVLAGHSAGGRLVQRYAAVGHGQGALLERGVHLRYVVANPSDYLYLTADRPVDLRAHADAASVPCPALDRWPYGLGGGLPSYVAQPIDRQALERGYLERDVVYLLGTADNDPAHHQLDRSCAAQAQGSTRFDRGTRYVAQLSSRPHGAWTHRLLQVPGVGHSSGRMFSSACGRAALFDQPGCAPGAGAAAHGKAQ